jgi:hypothetical protein
MKKYVVIYSLEGGMRERTFGNEQEQEANDFAATVKGSVCPFEVKTKLTGKAKKEQNRIKKFGYGV